MHHSRFRLTAPLVAFLVLALWHLAGCGSLPPGEVTSSTQQQVVSCPAGQTLYSATCPSSGPCLITNAEIRSATPTVNYGTQTAMNVGLVGSPAAQRSALIGVDVSAIPSGAAIQSVTLTLTTNAAAGTSTSGTTTVHANLGAWTESVVTWSSTPAYGAVLQSVGNTTATSSPWVVNAGLVSTVQGWLGAGPNYGLRLEGGTAKMSLQTSKSTTVASRPRMDICYLIPPTCTDATKNGTETDVDCGGGTCPNCANGLACLVGTDCTSGTCTGGVCVASTICADGVKNGSETDVDCGGGTCPACASGDGCAITADCGTGLYCEIGASWALSSYPSEDHTCKPVATNAITVNSSCSLPSPTTVTATSITITSTGIVCDVYQPTSGTNLPVVVYLPYGGFAAPGITNADAVAFARTHVTTGKVGIVCGYRGATSSQKTVPEALADVRCAVRTWGSAAGGTVYGSGYRGDPSRLGVVGSSAGGSLAAMAALTADQATIGGGTITVDDGTCTAGSGSIAGMAKRVVLAAPPTDITGVYGWGNASFPTPTGLLDNYAGSTTNPARLDALTAVSPAILPPHPYPGAPLFLIIGSSADTTVDPAQLTQLKTALDDHGFSSTHIVAGDFISGGVHYNHPWQFNACGVDCPANCTLRDFLAGL